MSVGECVPPLERRETSNFLDQKETMGFPTMRRDDKISGPEQASLPPDGSYTPRPQEGQGMSDQSILRPSFQQARRCDANRNEVAS